MRKDIGKIRDVYFYENSRSLSRRRKIVAMSVFGLANAAFMTLYQTGIIKRLPDFPVKFFDANEVTSSEKAFEFGMPDAPGASLLYSLIMSLATYGGKKELRRHLIFEQAMLAAILINAGFAIQYFYNMLKKQKRICIYCVTATVTNLAMIPPAMKEVEHRRERSA